MKSHNLYEKAKSEVNLWLGSWNNLRPKHKHQAQPIKATNDCYRRVKNVQKSYELYGFTNLYKWWDFTKCHGIVHCSPYNLKSKRNIWNVLFLMVSLSNFAHWIEIMDPISIHLMSFVSPQTNFINCLLQLNTRSAAFLLFVFS